MHIFLTYNYEGITGLQRIRFIKYFKNLLQPYLKKLVLIADKYDVYRDR